MEHIKTKSSILFALAKFGQGESFERVREYIYDEEGRLVTRENGMPAYIIRYQTDTCKLSKALFKCFIKILVILMIAYVAIIGTYEIWNNLDFSGNGDLIPQNILVHMSISGIVMFFSYMILTCSVFGLTVVGIIYGILYPICLLIDFLESQKIQNQNKSLIKELIEAKVKKYCKPISFE